LTLLLYLATGLLEHLMRPRSLQIGGHLETTPVRLRPSCAGLQLARNLSVIYDQRTSAAVATATFLKIALTCFQQLTEQVLEGAGPIAIAATATRSGIGLYSDGMMACHIARLA
jgi:hypothetical protein